MYTVKDLFDLSRSRAGVYLSGFEFPWEALDGIKNLITEIGRGLDKNEFTEVSPEVWIHKNAVVAPTAFIGAPCIIDDGTEIRHCAFIRGSALIGKNCVVGNSCEIKNSILFDNVQTPHFNYVGDSILGYKAHMGAGSITSNVKSDSSNIVIKADVNVKTGLKKCGAMLGDFAEIGCNTVLNPGTVVGRKSNIYPLSSVRGVVPKNSIYKSADAIITKE